MKKIAIVAATFYEKYAESLIDGASQVVNAAGYEAEVVTVPGALEIPAAIALAAESERYEGYVALGCVIRGETTHYDTVCNESARALMDLAVHGGLAIGNGILTVENDDQAWVRADVKQKNKGGDAARACLALLDIKERMLG
jgi:6,7-dimethyl-8-ribityllumazine synthase